MLNEFYQFYDNGIKPESLKTQNDTQIYNELKYFINNYNLTNQTYISYNREAYHGNENKDFRLTFDSDIKTRTYNTRLELGDDGDIILPADYHLMEVKILGAIPLWFATILSDLKIYPASFSKYGTVYKEKILNKKEN